jgi:hypothetical protein
MRKFIVEQMNKGVSLEDLHIAVEKMFNEEYNKREAEKLETQKRAAQGAALKRAARATADYFNSMLEREEYTAEEFEFMLHDLAGTMLKAEQVGVKAVVKRTTPVIQATKAEDKDIEFLKAEDKDIEAIHEFLKSISGK